MESIDLFLKARAGLCVISVWLVSVLDYSWPSATQRQDIPNTVISFVFHETGDVDTLPGSGRGTITWRLKQPVHLLCRKTRRMNVRTVTSLSRCEPVSVDLWGGGEGGGMKSAKACSLYLPSNLFPDNENLQAILEVITSLPIDKDRASDRCI